MEIIVDCPRCGDSSIETIKNWVSIDEVHKYIGKCKSCETVFSADLIPYENSIKLFVNEV